jgi:hypothetical protein
MKVLWQAAVTCGVGISALVAENSFAWKAPQVVVSVFSHEMGLLATEREEYATNLATHASNTIARGKASPASLAAGRRLLGLALQLSPRNRRAVVLNFQLSKGLLPEITESSYSPEVLARLLLTRGQLLEKQGGMENQMLARYFIPLAAEMDPKNEDAVYASEVLRLDHGMPDWAALSDAVKEEP